MEKFKFFAISFVATCLFWQCRNENVAPSQAKINFDNIAVGQKSLYIAWESNNIWDENITFKQTTDTLSLTVISRDSTGFQVEEKHLNDPSIFALYHFKIKGDTLFVEHSPTNVKFPRFSPFLFFDTSTHYVFKDNNLAKLNTNLWAMPKYAEVDIQILQLFAKIGNFKIMGKDYDSAFIYYNRSPMFVDGLIITRIYTKKDGFISFQPIGGKTTSGRFYNLIP
jgi:hypothetical protein